MKAQTTLASTYGTVASALARNYAVFGLLGNVIRPKYLTCQRNLLTEFQPYLSYVNSLKTMLRDGVGVKA